MKDSTKKILLIGGSILILGGVGYWFYYSSKKKKEKAAAEAAAAEAAATAAAAAALAAQQQQQSGGSTPSEGGSNLSVPTELNTIEKRKAFQDWMDTIGPWVKNASGKYEKLNKGIGYGSYGPSTQAAWNGYKDRYLSSYSTSKVDEYNKFLMMVKEAKIKRTGASGQYAEVELSGNKFIEIYPNGRFWYGGIVNDGAVITKQWTTAGNYSKGGRKMVVTFGPKKGSTFDTNSFWDTVALLK